MTDNSTSNDLLALTTEIVAAHVSNNTVAVGDLPQLINQVYQSLSSIGKAPAPAAERPQPAVSVKRSVHPDYIICLEDGKKLKMLKRHLKTAYDMTPDDYRERWGTPWWRPTTPASAASSPRRSASARAADEPTPPSAPPGPAGKSPIGSSAPLGYNAGAGANCDGWDALAARTALSR